MRSPKKQKSAAVARRHPKRRLPGARGLATAWALVARIRNARLRLPAPLSKGLQACIPSSDRPRSLYDLVAWFRPETRRCLIGVLALAIAFLSLWIFVFAPQGFLNRTTIETMIAGSRATNGRLADRNLALQDEIERLQEDPETIEALARNELNMAFPNETIYRPREEGPPAYVLNIRPRTETIQ